MVVYLGFRNRVDPPSICLSGMLEWQFTFSMFLQELREALDKLTTTKQELVKRNQECQHAEYVWPYKYDTVCKVSIYFQIAQ